MDNTAQTIQQLTTTLETLLQPALEKIGGEHPETYDLARQCFYLSQELGEGLNIILAITEDNQPK